MYICYLCNGLEKLEAKCPQCHHNMHDAGKVADYYDDYAAYIDIQDAQLIDGVPKSEEKHQCVHLGVCSACNYMEEIIINEKLAKH
ncbi:hypothetical protein SAMN04487944_11142 [Gracilibacillus ureilyticus]|uniref:Uncharacterized protein n=1 Tax=Gracilibacillus ureilyticus TaxID=531814 RepID=A0A1H9SIG6_9BACI|nr:hypothetical protein [Gracilibacillus ureilyticus]SER84741.1 hypothetical protein SAMN04487944_11142 [Gracilibacillus ureilyticus]